jgi:polysaccharide deacetylase family protein (PEP-CTERM system associated)
MKNALTFDVEDWLQSTYIKSAKVRDIVIRQTLKVLQILSDTEIRATFFIQGLIAEAFPQVVKEIDSLGHEIGTHGYAHEFVFQQTPQAFRDDLRKSIVLLEDIVGEKIIGYRAPDFSIIERSLWALDILRQEGILYDSSIFPIKNRRYGIPNFKRFPHRISDSNIIEFPLSTLKVFGANLPVSGGGYFRLLPYAIIKYALKQINIEGMPFIVYMHPYEFDTNDLTYPLKEAENMNDKKFKFMQNLNRDKSESKLYNLIRDFDFCPAMEVLSLDR